MLYLFPISEFLMDILYEVKEFPFSSQFVECFYNKGVITKDLVKGVPCLYRNDPVILVLGHMTLTEFCMWQINHAFVG